MNNNQLIIEGKTVKYIGRTGLLEYWYEYGTKYSTRGQLVQV